LDSMNQAERYCVTRRCISRTASPVAEQGTRNCAAAHHSARHCCWLQQVVTPPLNCSANTSGVTRAARVSVTRQRHDGASAGPRAVGRCAAPCRTQQAETIAGNCGASWRPWSETGQGAHSRCRACHVSGCRGPRSAEPSVPQGQQRTLVLHAVRPVAHGARTTLGDYTLPVTARHRPKAQM
jgi:hypothetical protein